MNRRAFLAVSGATLLAGCSQAEELATEATGGGGLSLGDSATFGEIEVTVMDSMTANEITINGNKKTSPGNGIFALFEVKAYNSDVTERKIPHVSETHYETLEEDENTIYRGDINDIRVYGDGDGGHFPDVSSSEKMRIDAGEFEIGVDGESLETYPAGSVRPRLKADTSISGWIVGVIDAGATPELRINFEENEETWTTDD